MIVTDEEDLTAEVGRLTASKGVRLIFDPVAGPYIEPLSECLSEEGTLIIYGGLANQPGPFPRQLAIRKNLTLRGYNFFPLLGEPVRFGRAFDYIFERVRNGRFDMPIAHRFPLTSVAEAHTRLEENRHIGKIILEP